MCRAWPVWPCGSLTTVSVSARGHPCSCISQAVSSLPDPSPLSLCPSRHPQTCILTHSHIIARALSARSPPARTREAASQRGAAATCGARYCSAGIVDAHALGQLHTGASTQRSGMGRGQRRCGKRAGTWLQPQPCGAKVSLAGSSAKEDCAGVASPPELRDTRAVSGLAATRANQRASKRHGPRAQAGEDVRIGAEAHAEERTGTHRCSDARIAGGSHGGGQAADFRLAEERCSGLEVDSASGR